MGTLLVQSYLDSKVQPTRLEAIYYKYTWLQEPLVHAPIGKYAAAGGWRFLIFNNKALLDSPGESFCVEKDGEVEVSYIPLDENSDEVPVMAQLEVILNIVSNNIHISGKNQQH